MSQIVFNSPDIDLETQVASLQTTLASLNQQIIFLQETLQERDQKIADLESSLQYNQIKEDDPLEALDTLTIVDLLINLYQFLLPRKTAP